MCLNIDNICHILTHLVVDKRIVGFLLYAISRDSQITRTSGWYNGKKTTDSDRRRHVGDMSPGDVPVHILRCGGGRRKDPDSRDESGLRPVRLPGRPGICRHRHGHSPCRVQRHGMQGRIQDQHLRLHPHVRAVRQVRHRRIRFQHQPRQGEAGRFLAPLCGDQPGGRRTQGHDHPDQGGSRGEDHLCPERHHRRRLRGGALLH